MSQRIGNSRKVDELTPQERRFCALRVRGYSQTQAWREAFSKPRVKVNIASSRASEVARRPRVVARIKALFREAKKSDLLSHAEYLDNLQSDYFAAKEAGNWTAAAAFARLIGQAIGSLEQRINVSDERLSDDELMKRLAAHDPVMAERLQRVIAGRQEFDA